MNPPPPFLPFALEISLSVIAPQPPETNTINATVITTPLIGTLFFKFVVYLKGLSELPRISL